MRTISFLFILLIAALGVDAGAAMAPAASITKAVAVTTATDTATQKKKLADSLAKKNEAAGPQDIVEYTADVIDYDMIQKQLLLKGHAQITYQGMILYADTIEYATADNLLFARGKPVIIEGGDTTVGESLVFNIKTRRGRVEHATTHADGSAFNGRAIMKSTGNELYIEQGDMTTCANVEAPHFYFYGRNIKIIPGDQAVARPMIFNIAEVPVAVLPYFVFPLDRNRRSGILTPIWGGHPANGGYLDNIGYYFVPNDYIDLTVWGRLQEFQDLMLNASSRYALRYWLNGSLSAKYVASGDYLRQNQHWSLDYSHSQNLTPDASFTLGGRGSLVSDQKFYARFTEDTTQIINKLVTANLSLNKRFDNISASAALSWNRTHNLLNNNVDEDLPSFSFSLPSRSLFSQPSDDERSGPDVVTPWYSSITGSYSLRGNVKRSAPGSDSVKGFLRSGINQSASVSAPQKLFEYFTLNPSLSVQASTFDAYINNAIKGIDTIPVDTLIDTIRGLIPAVGSTAIDTIFTLLDTSIITHRIFPAHPVTRHDTTYNYCNTYGWSAGANFSTNLYGLFPLKLFNFAGIRHTLTPSVGYTYVPEYEMPYSFFPIGLSSEIAHPRSQTVSFSLGNTFQGKTIEPATAKDQKPRENKFTILTGSINASYNFEAPVRKWSNLNIAAGTAYEFIRLNYSSTFWLYDQNNLLSAPILNSYTISLTSGSLGASGTLWDGELAVLDSVYPVNDIMYSLAGPQRWNVSISPAYTFSQTRASPVAAYTFTKSYTLNASASLNYSRIWSVSWNSYYNFVSNQLVGHSLNFNADLECWALQFSWSPSGYNPGYYFLINIKKIPEIKWEQRNIR